MATKDEILFLELGQIIKIISPQNKNLNNKIFIIDYLDKEIIKLINNEDLKTTTIKIKNQQLSDETIQEFVILYTPEKKGYAKQKGLITNKWISIEMGGTFPIFINGKIVNLEEDQIEILTHPEKKTIYIDFAYKGIPKNLPIVNFKFLEIEKSIEICNDQTDESVVEIDKTKLTKGDLDEVEKTDEEKKDEEVKDDEEKEDDEDILLDDLGEELEEEVHIPDISDKLNEIIIQADEITFGDSLEEVEEESDVKEEERRYGIETQTNDMLDEFLASVPSNLRTRKVRNNIDLLIERFKQLRQQFSNFDEKGNAETPKIKTHNFKPLKEHLLKLDKNIKWLIPIVKNKKKIYDEIKKNNEYNDDILPLTLAESLEEQYEIHNQYVSNEIPDEENKYDYYHRGIDQYFTPFETDTNKKNVLIEKRVNDNIDVINDSLHSFNSSTICNNKVFDSKFVFDKYIKGVTRLHVDEIKKIEMKAKRIELTNSDRVSIKGFVSLSDEMRKYYKLFLPKSNIISKIKVNHINFSMEKILSQKEGSYYNINEDEINKELNSDEKNEVLFRNMHSNGGINYIYNDNDDEKYEDINHDEKYDKFLEYMIPKTKTIIKYIKFRIKNGINYEKIMSELESFLIYDEDITFKQYTFMNSIIAEQIEDYRKKYMENISKCVNYVLKSRTNRVFSELNYLIPKKDRDEMSQMFNLNIYEKENSEIKNDTTSETIHKILSIDNGNYYTNYITSLNKHLIQTESIDDIIEEQKIYEEKDKEDNKNTNCGDILLAKRYVDIDEVFEDNDNLDLKFDKKYDDQVKYEIMNEFEQDRNVLDAEELLHKLKNHLILKVGIKETLAEREALAMIEGFKRVIDGDYAILDVGTEEIRYFVRENNKWRMDKNFNNQVEGIVKFCNVRENCIKINKSCETNEVAKNKIKKNLMQDIINNFDNTVAENYELYTSNLNRKINSYKKFVEKIKLFNKMEVLKYNKKHIEYASDIKLDDIIVSPHEDLRDVILSQTDITKRYTDILTFIENYCYEKYFTWSPTDEQENEQENEQLYWYYCKETNVKLLPNFYKEIAEAYINGFDESLYNLAVNRICNYRGVISDDGDKIVDKWSGYYIKNITFDESEGYDEQGFKKVSRSVISDEIVFNDFKQSNFNYSSKLANQIKKIVSVIDKKINVSLSDKYNFIIKNATTLVEKNVGNEEDYNKKMEKKKQKNKKLKINPYEKVYDEILLFSIMGLYITAIQITIPSIKSLKTYDSCENSFEGYPLNNTNMGILKYICCVFLKTKSSDRPWNVIPNSSKKTFDNVLKKMMEKLKNYMDSYIVNKTEIKSLIDKKKEWMMVNPDDELIPRDFHLENWTTFLPPLIQIKPKRAVNISSEFKQLLENNIKKGDNQQFERLWDLKGKLINYSLMIQESIQNVINNQPLLLNTLDEIPFVENACCHDGMNSVYKFFAEKENIIYKYNKNLKILENVYNHYNNIHKPSIIFSNENTKIIFPELSSDFTEENIYLTFMKHCKFNTNINLSENIKNLCINQKSKITKTMTLEEKIELLKKDGNNYNLDTLKSLLHIINNNNSVVIKYNINSKSKRQHFEETIEKLKNKTNTVIDKQLLNIFKDINDRFQIHFIARDKDEGIDGVLEYMKQKNNTLKNKILDFIKKYSKSKEPTKFLKNLNKWKQRKNDYLLDDDNNGYYIYTVMKQFIDNVNINFPTMIMNKVELITKIPKHWKLSESHQADFKNVIETEFKSFKKMFNDKNVNNILKIVKDKTKDIILLCKHIPFFSKFNSDGTIIKTIFDGNIIKHLSIYLFLKSITTYIDITDEDDFNYSQEEEEEELFSGEKETIKRNISEILIIYFTYFNKYKKLVDMSNEEIIKNVLKVKEKEKERKKDQLKNLSDESREIEDLLKKHKLGEWGLGLTSAVFKYDKSQYDKERQELIDIAFEEKKKGLQDDVTEMNKDIYKLDFSQEQMVTDRIESEVYNISHLPEDDDDGENDAIDYS